MVPGMRRTRARSPTPRPYRQLLDHTLPVLREGLEGVEVVLGDLGGLGEQPDGVEAAAGVDPDGRLGQASGGDDRAPGGFVRG